jgi:hypothetical protein
MSTTSKVINSVLEFLRLLKDPGKDMELTGSIFSPQRHKGALLLLLVASYHTPFGRRLTGIRSQLGCHC